MTDQHDQTAAGSTAATAELETGTRVTAGPAPFTPTRVVTEYDDFSPEHANVDELRGVLERITGDLTSWNQGAFCDLNGVAEPITEAHVESGDYHGYALAGDVVNALRETLAERQDRSDGPNYVPVGTCGTAFCVAGHVALRNGWTFVADVYENTSYYVVPTARVADGLKAGFTWKNEIKLRDVSQVAREVLNITLYDADALFGGWNTLLDVWALGYGISGGRLHLPDRLPETWNRYGELITPELTTPDDVRDAINYRLAQRVTGAHDRYATYVDVDRLETLVDDPTRVDRITGARFDRSDVRVMVARLRNRQLTVSID